MNDDVLRDIAWAQRRIDELNGVRHLLKCENVPELSKACVLIDCAIEQIDRHKKELEDGER